MNDLDAGYERHPVQDIKVGDQIEFSDGAGNTVTKKVTRIVHHNSMRDFLEEVDTDDVMPGMSYEDILKNWAEISRGREGGYGIKVFELA